MDKMRHRGVEDEIKKSNMDLQSLSSLTEAHAWISSFSTLSLVPPRISNLLTLKHSGLSLHTLLFSEFLTHSMISYSSEL